MATIFQNESSWSTTESTNANVDTGINWAENQDAATVNNSARGMMAARAKARLDQGGERVATGTGDALVLVTNQVLTPATHLAAGLRLAVRAIADNTIAAVTLAVDGATPTPIKRTDGSALGIGSIKSGMMLDLVYNAASSEWRAVNITPVAGSGGQAAFSAHKNGTNQTVSSATPTKVSFGTEAYDVGDYFAAGRWTPPAGIVSIGASILLSSYDGAGFNFFIYKNGSGVKAVVNPGANTAQIAFTDQANGTDYYEMYIDSSTDISYVVDGSTNVTWFTGAVL